MKRIVLMLLVACVLGAPVAGHAKTKTSPEMRAAQKVAKQQQKALAKYYKAQQKAQKRQLKQAQKRQQEEQKRLWNEH